MAGSHGVPPQGYNSSARVIHRGSNLFRDRTRPRWRPGREILPASDESGPHHQLARLRMASPLQPAGSTANRVRIVVATSVMLTFISYWRAAAIVLNDLGSSAFYAAGIAEQAVGKSAPWFIVGGHAVLLRGARGLRGKLFHVRARRRLPRGQGSAGRHPGQDQRFRPDVRLHPDRTHLRRFRRTIHRRTDQRHLRHRRRPWLDPASHARHLSRRAARRRQLDLGRIRRGRDDVFLVAEHQGHSGIQRKGPAGHADHHRDGDHPAGLVGPHLAEAGISDGARCPPPTT